MKRSRFFAADVFFAISLIVSASAYAQNCQKISGDVGDSARWQSGWLDVPTITAFNKGDRLRLSLGGNAAKVVVRILRSYESPEDRVGIIGVYAVPANRKLDVIVEDDMTNVKQISVHGGSNPWGRYPLGGGNGSVTLDSVERACR